MRESGVMNTQDNTLRGLAIRQYLTDCPLGAFSVRVRRCDGKGECASVCPVKVFTTNSRGQCVVVNDALCFGCTACMAQCLEDGIEIIPRDPPVQMTPEDLLT